jgi:hypothetical protein
VAHHHRTRSQWRSLSRRADFEALQENSDSWSVLVTRLAIKGDKGDRGETGPRGPAGQVARTARDCAFATPQRSRPRAAVAGQMAIVTSTNALYRGTGTTAGAWTLIPTTAGQ